jgi:hypothetical protein
MRKLIAFTITIIINANLVSAQSPFGSQMKVAQNYMILIMNGQQEKAWQLFDKNNVPNVTKEQFETTFTYIKSSLNAFDTFALLSTISKVTDNRTLNMYRFKAQSKGRHILADVFVDLTFVDKSELVAGLESFTKQKDSTSLTSTNKETPIEKQFTAVLENKSYNIRGINLVHLGNNAGLLAIQITRKITPEEFESQGWAKIEAVKFAKYLKSEGYIEKAKQKAIELKLDLMETLGVSFIDLSTGKGINVPIKPEEFK